MLSTLFRLGPFAIHSYGLMIAIAFLLGLHLIKRDMKKRLDIDPDDIGTIALWSLILGIVGARLLHIIMFSKTYSFSDPIGWIAIWKGGLVFQGVFPFVLLYCFYASRRYKIPFWAGSDCVMPYLAMAHAFGRVGCFLNGCCYGKQTDLPWGLPFPRVPYDLTQTPTGSPVFIDQWSPYNELANAYWSHPVHPTQLYGVIGLLSTCAMLLLLRKYWHPFDGFTFPLYFILYGAGRIFVEFFRGDHNPTFLGAFSQQQVFSLLFIAVGVVVFALLRARAKRMAEPAVS